AAPAPATLSPQVPLAAPSRAFVSVDSVAPDPVLAIEPRSAVVAIEAMAPPSGAASAPLAYLNNPSPAYPESARRDGQEGLTVVEVLVSKSGAPVDVRIATTSGVAALDDAAVAGVKRWVFAPAARDHAAIEARIRIPIRFRLDDETR
ncbi:MAG: TonB family protein, partial [Betaproteobacteria bacterium]